MQLRVEPFGRVAIGREQHALGGHRAARRRQPVLAARLLPGGHRRMGVDACASAHGGLRQPTHVAQRMQAEIVRHDQAALRLGRAQQALLHLGLAPQRPPLAEQPLHRAGDVLQHVPAVRPMGHEMLALARRLDIDAFLGGEPADQRHSRLLCREEPGRLLHPVALRHRSVAELAAAQAAKAAIAARRTPADRARLQHDRLDAMVAGQVVGGGQAGVAAADDRHVGRYVALERLDPGRLGSARRFPVAADGARRGRNARGGRDRSRSP